MNRLGPVLLTTAALFATACGGGERPAREAREVAKAPAWQDVFDSTPELLGVVRPRALKQDAVYGSFFKSVVRGALARSASALAGSSAIEILEGTDEVVFGMTRSEETRRDAAVLVLRGVGAAYEPSKLVDERGNPLFHLRDERARVPEYTATAVDRDADGALFVLPNRVWVVTLGEATPRARQAFATPLGRPEPTLDRDALAYVRLGAKIVAAPRYAKSPVFGALAKKLDSVTVALDPAGKGGRVVLAYADEDAAAYGELQAKQLVSGIAESDPKRFTWLSEATESRSSRMVTVRLPVPPRLLEDLAKSGPPDVLGL